MPGGSLAAAQKYLTSVNEDIEKQSFSALDDGLALSHAFSLFDADGDGKLTEEEVVAALARKTGQGTELSEEAARATWKGWQRKYDLNKDGKISYEEMVKMQAD